MKRLSEYATVDQGVETPAHERVVQRPDREQLLVLEVARHPELAERQEEVHLGDPELHVAARRRDVPRERRALGVGIYRLFVEPEHARPC